MQNNAVTILGTGYSGSGGLANGFSKPSAVQIPSGSDDVAFALSYCEAANFCSKTYDTNGGGGTAASNSTAIKNYGKISIPQTWGYGMWLRSPGSQSYTAGALDYTGRAFQFHLTPESVKEYGFLYPALWVDQAIFDD